MRKLVRWLECDAAHGWSHDTTPHTVDGHAATMLSSPIVETDTLFCEAIPSWAAHTPKGSWIDIELRVRQIGEWSAWYRLARWDDQLEASVRTSFAAQRDKHARVAVDTLVASTGCESVQARVTLVGMPQPTLQTFTLILSDQSPLPKQHDHLPLINEILIPLRSQLAYPNGGNVWCSPTSVVMLAAYWHGRTGDPLLAPYLAHEAVPERAVKLCYDPAYDGTGNWIFNTAFAASLGLDAYVTRLCSLEDIVPWVEAGVPLIISTAWGNNELYGAAINASSGHLMIVTGFDGDGCVLVADPAFKDVDQVRHRYKADQLERAWLKNSQGTVYVIHPYHWPVPSSVSM